MTKVGIDIDWVVADTLTPWISRCNKALRKKHALLKSIPPRMDWTAEELTEYNFWNQIKLPEAEAWEVFTPDIYDSVLPYPEAKKAVDDIVALGHQVHFVSSCRTSDEFSAKIAWLKRHEMWHQTNGMWGVGEWAFHKTKATVPVDWLVDDHVPNCENFPGYALLVTRSHNRNIITHIKRIRSLADVPLLLGSQPLLHPAQADGDAGETQTLAEMYQQRNPAAAGSILEYDGAGVRKFATGATRDTDNGKLDYEGFLSPLVLERFAQFMHKNRLQKDGQLRDSDNWQKGIPMDAYIKSGFRHFMSWWKLHRSATLPTEEQIDEVCALLFNVQGYLHELLKTKEDILGAA